jgi:putative serine protease PepD
MTFAGQPASPPGGGRGRGALAVVGMVVLMAVSAAGGGIAGAAIYAQTQDEPSAAPETRVVDAPQLDYTSLASVASQVSPSVVSIRIGDIGGSGVVMSTDGYIITNAHVLAAAPPGQQIQVQFSNGEFATAVEVGSDARSDIAVIKVDGVSGLTPATFADSDDALVGDTVLAIGSPLGYDGSVSQGIISALDRTLAPEQPGDPSLSGLFQIDAAINPGNSGGALANLAGEVVGINTAIANEDPNDPSFIGIGFAIPSNRAMDVAQTLIDGREVSHAFLGVNVGDAPEGGAVIGQVTENSPAAEAGLQPGDIVVRVNERTITDSGDLVSTVQAAQPGDELQMEYVRNGVSQTTTVTLVEATD